MHGLAKDR
jgi:hypothetical protein